MPSDSTQVIANYSTLAGTYDEPGNVQSCWTVHGDHIVASLKLKSTFQTVVDVGCGTGRALWRLASRNGRPVGFVGVEPAPEMRRRALALTKDLSNVRILDGTFERLPIEQSSVDYLFSIDAFHWAANPSLAVSEMARVMKPSGEMDHFFNGWQMGREFIQATTPIYMSYLGLRSVVEAAKMRRRLATEEALALFARGFGRARVQVHEVYHTYYDTVDGHLGWWVRFEPQLLPQLLAMPLERRRECQREIRAALAALETAGGVPYTMHQLHVQVR